MNEPAPHLSVIVVTHNTEPVLKAFLESLKTAVASIDHELIVVDNNSSDRSVALVKEMFAGAQVIQNKTNTGFARAVNQGGAKAQGEWLLLLNPDLVLDPDCIDNLLEQAVRYDDLGLATGRICFPDGSFQSVCRHLPTITNLIFSRGFFLSRLFGQHDKYTLGDFESDTPVPAIAGTMMLCRRSIWTSLGGFDERFFMFMEDTDLCRRAGQAGLTNYYFPKAQATHAWGRGSNISSGRRKLYHHRSMWLYFRKHHNGILAWSLVPLFLMLNFCFSLIFKPERSAGT